MDFGGLVCSGSSWELILGFLSGPNASWVSVLPTKPAGKVWATSKKIFWGGCTNTVKSRGIYIKGYLLDLRQNFTGDVYQ